MPYTLSEATGQDWTPLTVGGKQYQLTPLTLEQLGQIEAWVKAQFPDPIETAKRLAKDLPVELARDVIARAQEKADNPRWCLGTPAASAVLRSIPGLVEMLVLQLKKYHPELTRDNIAAIATDLFAEASSEDATDATSARLEAIALAHEQRLEPVPPKVVTTEETSP